MDYNTCEKCKKEFIPTKSKKSQKYCSKECRYKNWTKNNRERLNATVRKYRAKRYKEEGKWRETGAKVTALRKWMNEIKSKPCCDCGNTFEICCMDFDHREGTTKSYNIGSMFAHHYSMELIQIELKKCDLVCANCHRIRTRDRRTGSGKSHLKNI
jgi:hypothetical protein